MNANLGTTDRVIRTALGVTLIGVGMARKNWLGVLGLYPLITGIIGTCPVYSALGISTCKTYEDEILESYDEEPVEVAAP